MVLVFKSTSLAYTITLMEVMGHGQLLYGRTYDVMVFGAAGIIYLIVNGLLTLLMRPWNAKRWPSSDVAST